MARVKVVEIKEAEGTVERVFNEQQKVRGEGIVTNLFKGFAISPHVLGANWSKLKALMGYKQLSHMFKEGLAVSLAVKNKCAY